jgi:hypothetical protein
LSSEFSVVASVASEYVQLFISSIFVGSIDAEIVTALGNIRSEILLVNSYANALPASASACSQSVFASQFETSIVQPIVDILLLLFIRADQVVAAGFEVPISAEMAPLQQAFNSLESIAFSQLS